MKKKKQKFNDIDVIANLMSLFPKISCDLIFDLNSLLIVISLNVIVKLNGIKVELKRSIQKVIPLSFKSHELIISV